MERKNFYTDEERAERLRRLTPEQRMDIALRMSEAVRQFMQFCIAARHPEYSAEEVRHAFSRQLHGDELFRRAWPKAPLLDP